MQNNEQNNGNTRIKSPVGRLVQGSVFEGRKVDFNGTPFTYKTGADAGQPYEKYQISVAYEKTNPEWPEFYGKIYNVGMTGFPHLFDPQTRACIKPTFAWKIIDGDSRIPDEGGKRPCDKPGFPGCYVVRYSTNKYPPSVCDKNGEKIIDPNAMKRGDYVQIVGDFKANGDSAKSGIFVSHKLIILAGYGKEIITGIDAKAAVAGGMGYTPAGMSNIPTAPVNVPQSAYQAPPPAQGAAPAYQAPPPAQGAAPAYQAPPPAQGAAPAYQAPPPAQGAAPAYQAPPATDFLRPPQ